MKRLLIILLFPFLGCTPSINTLQSYERIDQMKNSALLVKLSWPTEKLELQRKYGQNKKADKKETRINKVHSKIVSAFSDFDFCPIYFFYIDPKYDLADFEAEDLFLHDKDLSPLPDMEVPETYFIGHFTTETTYTNEEPEEIYGFEILQSNLYPIDSPFPRFERIYAAGPLATYEYSILRLEKNLERHYQKNLLAQKKGNK